MVAALTRGEAAGWLAVGEADEEEAVVAVGVVFIDAVASFSLRG